MTKPAVRTFGIVRLMPLLPLEVDDLWRREDRAEQGSGGVELKVIDEKTVVVRLAVDGEDEFEMARMVDLELEGPAMSTPQLNRAAGAFDGDGDDLSFGKSRPNVLDSIGNLDVSLADFGRDEEPLNSGKSQEARRKGEGLQQHRADTVLLAAEQQKKKGNKKSGINHLMPVFESISYKTKVDKNEDGRSIPDVVEKRDEMGGVDVDVKRLRELVSGGGALSLPDVLGFRRSRAWATPTARWDLPPIQWRQQLRGSPARS